MARILITYGTTEGQTAKIAAVIGEAVRARGHEAAVVDVRELSKSLLEDNNAMIVGASVHVGKHDKHVVDFVQKNRASLENLPSAFFSVSLAAHGDTEEAAKYIEQFEAATGWHPAQVGSFSGALPYTQYGFVKRHLMKRISEEKPGSLGTDTSRDYVYTEWDGVKRFAEHFADSLEAQPEG